MVLELLQMSSPATASLLHAAVDLEVLYLSGVLLQF